MAHLPHVVGPAHERGENLIVVLTPAEISRHAVRHFKTCGIGIYLEKPDRRHDESRHAERALEALLVDDALLDRMQLAIGTGESFNGQDFLIANRMRQDRARVVWDVVDQNGTGSTLGAVAAQLGTGEP